MLEAIFSWATRDDPPPAWLVEARAKKLQRGGSPTNTMGSRGVSPVPGSRGTSPTLGSPGSPTQSMVGYPTGALYRYEFFQVLVKVALVGYVQSGEVDDVSEAVEKLMTERVRDLLPAETATDPNEFRDSTLYNLEIEAIFRTHLTSLHAIFEAYAGAGPTGGADLMSLSEWLSLISNLELFDSDFTPRDATLAFQSSRMRVVDEIKARVRLLNISFIDFFEAMLRVAMSKKLPTPEMLRKAGRRTAGEYYLELTNAPGPVYAAFLQQHIDNGVMTGNVVGMRAYQALEALISVIMCMIKNAPTSANVELTPEDMAAFMERADDKLKDTSRTITAAQGLRTSPLLEERR